MLNGDQSTQSDRSTDLYIDKQNNNGSVNRNAIKNARYGAHQNIVVVERNAFLRDCLQRSVADCLPGQVIGCASLSELCNPPSANSTVVLLSTFSMNDEEADEEIGWLTQLDPCPRVMVLGKNDDLNKVLFALSQGANGYISTSAGLDIFIQAIRFVARGGTYVPAQCVLEAKNATAQIAANMLAVREIAVIQAIRQGKPNKVIAYELNMCESTVKVHVRHIMKKLHARNRTDVAIKSGELAASAARANWSGSVESIRAPSSRAIDNRR